MAGERHVGVSERQLTPGRGIPSSGLHTFFAPTPGATGGACKTAHSPFRPKVGSNRLTSAVLGLFSTQNRAECRARARADGAISTPAPPSRKAQLGVCLNSDVSNHGLGGSTPGISAPKKHPPRCKSQRSELTRVVVAISTRLTTIRPVISDHPGVPTGHAHTR
jgi:hypothetical protein